MQNILLTGGTGYIGSHIAFLLAQEGYTVIILDRTATQDKTVFPGAIFIQEDYGNQEALLNILKHYQIDAVMHIAAYTSINESINNPLNFYDNNVIKTILLLECVVKAGILRFIFASSCAVYGNPLRNPIAEDHPCSPISPYGQTKYVIEQILQDCFRAYGLSSVIFRYFNVAGLQPDQNFYQFPQKPAHVIPIMLKAASEQKPFTIFGISHPTPDGTAVRDYVHVMDVARAHLRALEFLNHTRGCEIINVGSGDGSSIAQIINEIEKLDGKKITCEIRDQRIGDPSLLIADCGKAQKMLGWKAQHSTLQEIIGSVYGRNRFANSSKDCTETLPSLSTMSTPCDPVPGM